MAATMRIKLALVQLMIASLFVATSGFGSGAPPSTCTKPLPNRPYHGKDSTIESQSLSNNPYQIVASGNTYRPGSQITVRIQGDTFKGFFIQARDAQTNQWIGTWAQTPNTKSYAECAAVTHADPKDKQLATLIWNAPTSGRSGKVYFTGTVLKDYATFWADMVSRVQ
ncbi:hypothetical protein QAD02_004737 [Eretmocerus hayati]|uniref:Uncharacterized protein n=1 Tax=Eretmocerus hayati TaxID=131215 RepID=A0ACC2NQJ8_9HYME|nr:hypothetical protein QAD02_004737 [Eretmocerus hayati]